MTTFRFGDVSVSRIEEMAGPLFDAKEFFPDFNDAQFREQHHWLVPKHATAEGRLMASIHSWLVRTPKHTILIDGCVGDDKDRLPMRDWSHMKSGWLERLVAAGVRPEQVDYVLCTHLHVDHVGWNTRLKDGRWVPTFPNARYVFAKAEFEFWQQERQRPNPEGFDIINQKVFDDSVLPVMEAGLADMVNGHHELLDALLVIDPAPGHTPGSITIELTTPQRRGLFTGDILHHPVQVALPQWNSNFCTVAEQSRATRKAVLGRCADSGALMLPAHFAAPHAGIVSNKGGKFSFEFADA